MRHLFITFTLAFLTFGCQLPAQGSFDDMLKGLLDFSVPYVTTQELHNMDRDKLVLLDAREKEEYKVSHIEGARWIGYKSFDTEKVADLPKDATIVIYCSVGYRSEKIGEKLQEEGFSNVFNLYGSIFDWVNNGYPVVNDQGETEAVHAYNKNWGKWLRKGKKVY